MVYKYQKGFAPGGSPNSALVPSDMGFWRKSGGENAAARPARAPQPALSLFEEIMLPHLNAAHNLARWLTSNPADAQDVVQESYLRAFRFFDGYKGGDSKAWLLSIVRNTCRTWQRRRKRDNVAVPFDETAHTPEASLPNQEQSVAGQQEIGRLLTCIEMLPVEFREVLILRELEEMSYQQIAQVTGLPAGTVMSRLSRARRRLEDLVVNQRTEAAR
jgi:RNA polymerase sigma factor (sigma-70 family)